MTLSRRSFLGASAAAAAPLILPAPVLGRGGATAPNDRIAYGFVGTGSHARDWNMPQVFRCPDAEIVAVCDVDKNHLRMGLEKVEKHYRKQGVFATGDFRELIARRDVDVVYNGTPDHWHVIPSLMALRMKKDVICEKPLTLTVEEGRALVAAARETGRITQTASENRSIDTYLRLVEIVRNGRLGRLRHIVVSLPAGRASVNPRKDRLEPAPVPPELDWDMWQGQAPEAPYCPGRVHWNFRWNLMYSGGMLTDWGAHLIDLAQWGNDTERSGPVEVEGRGEFPPREAVWNTATTFDLHYRYANGVTMNVVSRGPGVRFEGTDGWVECQNWRSGLKASRPELLEDLRPGETPLYRPSEIVRNTDGGKGGEHRNFLDGVRDRRPCYAPFETGHRTITIAHIGNIAMMLGRKLTWDPQAERFVGDDEANRMLGRPQREPWTIANVEGWIRKYA